MLNRRVAKWILLLGAGLIGVLLILFFYISLRVKSDFENRINKHTQALKSQDLALDFKPFKCKGFLNYECKSPYLKISEPEGRVLVELEDFIIGFKNIKTKSMEEYARGKILALPFDAPLDFMPQEFEYRNDDSVLDVRGGEILRKSTLKLKAKGLWFAISGNMRAKSEDFVNKNIIKIAFHSYDWDFYNKLSLYVKDIELQLQSKNLKESYLDFLRQSEGELSDEQYNYLIDEKVKGLGFLMGMFGLFNTPYHEDLLGVLGGYADLLKGKISSVKVNLSSQDEVYFDFSYFDFHNPDSVQRFLAKIFNHYKMKVLITPTEGR